MPEIRTVTFYNELFDQNLDNNTAKLLFKSTVMSIEMAISSFCNRRCGYCPNHEVDRHTQNIKMDDALFMSILLQLKEIDYSEGISLHRYNEPLADVDYAISRICSIRMMLPRAKIVVFTNGDYLDRELIRLLAYLGVDGIVATIHPNSATSSFEVLKQKLIQKISRLSEYADFSEHDRSYYGSFTIDNLIVTFQAIDFLATKMNGAMRGTDRGGFIDNKSAYIRTAPCLFPFYQMQIEYDGKLLPCCNIHTDLEIHQPYVLGQITKQGNLFKEWTNPRYVELRRRMRTHDTKGPPCTTCDMGCPE